MPAPERRTRADIAAAVLIVVVLAGLGAAVWWTSDVRATTLRTASTPLPTTTVPKPDTLPSALREAWRAPSPATPHPVVLGGAVITADAGTVRGRELHSGQTRWHYRRERALCTVGAAFGRVIAVYRSGDNCSAVTSLHPAEGTRGPQRTSPLESPTRLVSGDSYVLATGRRYLEVWRSDLVATLRYGALPTPVEPGAQPRPGCRYASMTVADGLVGVIERCPGESVDRLTVLDADPEDADAPETVYTTLLPGSDASLVALTGRRAAVALPDPARLLVFDATGQVLARYPLPIPGTDLRGDPPSGVVPVTDTPRGLLWFTGSATVALDAGLRPRWTARGTLGAGTPLAGRVLVPVPRGLAVLDPGTGRRRYLLPVDRGGYRGRVVVAAAGAMLFEQRGDTLVALAGTSR